GYQYTMQNGQTVPSTYPLQVDAETAKANVVLSVAGPRGRAEAAVSIGAPHWHGPETVADQRDSIARLRAVSSPEIANDGLDRWENALDDEQRLVPSPAQAWRWGKPGRAVLRTAPQAAQLRLRSAWCYEPFTIGDRLYICTEGANWLSKELVPPLARLSSRRALRVDITAAPQLQDVRFSWLAMYLVTAGSWAYILYVPTVRTMTMRTMQFPRVFSPAPVPTARVSVSHDQSQRIIRTQTYAAALLSDVLYNPFMNLIGRIQGRFGVYQRSLQAGALCAIVSFRYGGFSRAINVFRRQEIVRPHLLLQVDGLQDPGIVSPFHAGLVLEGDPAANPDTIAEGY
ncbi:MAG: hypothetical protein IT336_15055, partial [Thermomicrobiales bacterium]|nr:hypothetical protein [Thermomicrobiales bacterium]